MVNQLAAGLNPFDWVSSSSWRVIFVACAIIAFIAVFIAKDDPPR